MTEAAGKRKLNIIDKTEKEMYIYVKKSKSHNKKGGKITQDRLQ